MKKKSNRSLTYTGFAAVLVLLGIAGFVVNLLVKRSDSDSAYAAIQNLATEQAQKIDQYFISINTYMTGVAKKNEVIDAVSQVEGNDAILSALAEQIKAGNPDAIKVELIPANQAKNFLLSFAEIDQVTRTEKGEVTSAEAILLRDSEWQFIVSVPIKTPVDKKIAGTLLISYRMDRIQPLINTFDLNLGHASLMQRYDGMQPIVIFTTEKQAPKIGTENLAQVGKSSWYISFTPSPARYIQSDIPSLYLQVLLGLIIILCGTLIFLVTRSARQGGIGVITTGDKPIQIASAKNVVKGGKADASLVSDLANQAAQLSEDDFNEISDPLFQRSDVFELTESDEEAPSDFGKATPAATQVNPTLNTELSSIAISPVIFRDYDIRGNADTYISNEVANAIGQAIGSEAQARGETRLVVAADGRLSSPRIKESLVSGILSSGVHVVDIGSVPSPVLYFVTETTDIHSGVMVTASHNSAADNGFKIVLDGKTLSDDHIQALYQRITTNNLMTGAGELSSEDYTNTYIEKITSDIALSSQLKVVLDCGNGIAGEIAPRILNELGCEVVSLFCDVDGNFPNHDPDPSIASNLNALRERVIAEKADLGIALDGDGDRLVAVTSSGEIVLPDRLLMIYAKDVVARNPGTDVVFDVKCTRKLNSLISGYGGRPLMWKSGHAHIRAKMQETGAMLGGELSGHIFFKERWHGFDDGIYAATRLLEILTMRDQSLDNILKSMPVSPITPEIRVPVDEDKKFVWVKRLIEKGDFSGGKITTIDGLRVDFAKGWGLVRASNTSAYLTLRFEADNDEMLEKIIAMFRQQIKAIIPELEADF